MKNRLVILTALVFVLIAAACSPAGSPDEASSAAIPPTAESTEPVMPAEPEAEVVVEPTQSEAMVEDAPTDVPTDEPVLVQESAPGKSCEVKDGLHATDPGTVSLASGDVQLVEFFAFW